MNADWLLRNARLSDSSPLVDLTLHVLRELGRGRADRLGAEAGKALAHIRQGENAPHLGGQFVHYRFGRAFGGKQARPGIGIKTGIA